MSNTLLSIELLTEESIGEFSLDERELEHAMHSLPQGISTAMTSYGFLAFASTRSEGYRLYEIVENSLDEIREARLKERCVRLVVTTAETGGKIHASEKITPEFVDDIPTLSRENGGKCSITKGLVSVNFPTEAQADEFLRNVDYYNY